MTESEIYSVEGDYIYSEQNGTQRGTIVRSKGGGLVGALMDNDGLGEPFVPKAVMGVNSRENNQLRILKVPNSGRKLPVVWFLEGERRGGGLSGEYRGSYIFVSNPPNFESLFKFYERLFKGNVSTAIEIAERIPPQEFIQTYFPEYIVEAIIKDGKNREQTGSLRLKSESLRKDKFLLPGLPNI